MNEVLKASLPSLLSAVLPTLMVLVGILLNKSDTNRLDTQMGKLTEQMSKLNDKVDKLDDRLNDKMGRMKDAFHSDIVMLVQRDGEKDNRSGVWKTS